MTLIIIYKLRYFYFINWFFRVVLDLFKNSKFILKK